MPVLRWLLVLASFCLLLAGCAAVQQERQPSRPIWFQKTDFTRPGNPETRRKDDPLLSVSGEILGGLLQALAAKP